MVEVDIQLVELEVQLVEVCLLEVEVHLVEVDVDYLVYIVDPPSVGEYTDCHPVVVVSRVVSPVGGQLQVHHHVLTGQIMSSSITTGPKYLESLSMSPCLHASMSDLGCQVVPHHHVSLEQREGGLQLVPVPVCAQPVLFN